MATPTSRRLFWLLALLLVCLCAIPFRAYWRRSVADSIQLAKGEATVSSRVAQFGPAVRARLAPDFKRLGLAYPPRKITLVGLKSERLMQVWVAGADGRWKRLRNYPILGQSGELGPKLQQGDMQVPEGLYAIESLNPNSRYHLALRVNYPSAADRQQGKLDGRKDLGSDIMIHGSNCSIGCLAMGDEAAEDLFVLAAETGIKNMDVILSPVDFRIRSLPAKTPPPPDWVQVRYAAIREALGKLTEHEPH